MAAANPHNKEIPSSTYTVKPVSEHTHTIILLHGLGSNGKTFGKELVHTAVCSNGKKLTEIFPGAKFIFPTSRRRPSTRFRRIMLTQWFDIVSLKDPSYRSHTQVEGLGESFHEIFNLINEESTKIPHKNIILGGLSQGCAMTLICMLGLDFSIGGFIGMSGWMPFRDEIEKLASSNHGEPGKDRVNSDKQTPAGESGAKPDGTSDGRADEESDGRCIEGSDTDKAANGERSGEPDWGVDGESCRESSGDKPSGIADFGDKLKGVSTLSDGETRGDPFNVDDRSPFDTDEHEDPLTRALQYVQELLSLDKATTTNREKSAVSTPVFLGHGTEDKTVRPSLGEDARRVLSSLGFSVSWELYDEQGHWYKLPDEIDDIAEFVKTKVGWAMEPEACGSGHVE